MQHEPLPPSRDGPIFGDSGLRQSLAEKFRDVHEEIKTDPRLGAVSRIAIALYDAKTDTLKTFIDSSEGAAPLQHYEAKLHDAAALYECFKTGRSRVVNDLSIYASVPREHARRIRAQGYRSSYTVPIYHNGGLFGFVFFDSYHKQFFQGAITRQLEVYARLVALLVVIELKSIRTVEAAAKTIQEMSHYRDVETGSHLDRMSRFARVIALALSRKFGLSDEYIEFLFQFAPLHDVGKIGIPDAILLKPAKLSRAKFEMMKTHVGKGIKIVDIMVRNFGLESMRHIQVLRNIVAYHHEAWDGSGYPYGLKNSEIPLEARITAVADVFDALTSTRPYKSAWSNEKALRVLQRMAGTKFDRDCVEALVRSMDRIREIQAQFREESQ